MIGEMQTPEDVFDWADGFTNLERGRLPFDKRNYRLDRMRRLLALFGGPERAFRTIHVAGTKGKGSTAALLSAVIDAAGGRCGLYTSPHVSSPLERISVSGAPPLPELFVGLGQELRERVERVRPGELPGGFPPTTFELYTMLAFLAFRSSGCTDAVVETGIGGRLDATNVVHPEASVITPLDLEHTEILGDTIERIAFEKAGIIKEGVPAFIAAQPADARRVFRDAARRRNAPLVFLDEELESLEVSLTDCGTSFSMKLKGMKSEEFRLSLLGRFQAENATLAYLVLRRCRPDIPRAAFQRGFLGALLPGRMEVIQRSPVIVVDGAHTPLAVRRLLESFSAIFPGEAVLIFGSVAGKRPHEMAEILAPAFNTVIVSTPGTFKASRPEDVYSIFNALNPRSVLEKDPAAALARARQAAAGRLPILVTGSFYMVAEIRKLVSGSER
jgi:dihydrofolate synthase/folylpolyglutamate synthase